jgi:hypothetical protein
MDHETTDRTTQTRAAFCPKCGQRSAGGSYCTRCGEQLTPDAADELAAAATRDLAAIDEPPVRDLWTGGTGRPAVALQPAPPPPPSSPTAPSMDRPSRGWIPWAILGVVVVLAAAGAAVYFVTRSDGDDAATSYRHDVASTFGPVLGANKAVSRSLTDLSHGSVGRAKAAVRQAQSAVTSAQGALGALDAPSGSQELASQARQALARETSYYAAVATILGDPGSPSADEVQTLAGNVTSALVAGGPTLAGTSTSISGTDGLTSWAGDAAHRGQHHAAPPATSGGSAAPAPSGTDCGSGVFAGPNTTCAFAMNVRAAYFNAPGTSATVRVFSPVTHQTYTMSCSPAGSGVTCSGGNNASVTF